MGMISLSKDLALSSRVNMDGMKKSFQASKVTLYDATMTLWGSEMRDLCLYATMTLWGSEMRDLCLCACIVYGSFHIVNGFREGFFVSLWEEDGQNSSHHHYHPEQDQWNVGHRTAGLKLDIEYIQRPSPIRVQGPYPTTQKNNL